MTEDEKMQVAVFRFGVIREFVTGAQISRTEKGQLLADKCARKWHIPFLEKTQISKGTIQRWRRLYAGAPLTLKTYPDRLCIYHRKKLIARHVRNCDRRQDIELPDHPKALLAQRRNLFMHVKVLLINISRKGMKNF